MRKFMELDALKVGGRPIPSLRNICRAAAVSRGCGLWQEHAGKELKPRRGT